MERPTLVVFRETRGVVVIPYRGDMWVPAGTVVHYSRGAQGWVPTYLEGFGYNLYLLAPANPGDDIHACRQAVVDVSGNGWEFPTLVGKYLDIDLTGSYLVPVELLIHPYGFIVAPGKLVVEMP